ncbi:MULTISPECIES: hypothetical protein [Bacteroides]|uniref:Uncharacterized protein n=1 Tax=Bacteroides faecis TaxID=674529 RepID=A0AAW5P1S7_9BACE|nr:MULTISPECIES: hypothetical protein [Bacteroides]MBS4790552.1 hypothetical protein [Bacteroides faecis]MBT9928574.1 hypothetical protein [Bacteroides faecis]MCB6635751.1 hypothetical protein [Bacteroides faecis]MCC0777053.1 hypothetical protein [Bacteroides faecis]MCC0780881.1 hypothetical protein [Bacteroides faecis]
MPRENTNALTCKIESTVVRICVGLFCSNDKASVMGVYQPNHGWDED